MTKKFAKITARRDAKSDAPGMIPLGATVNGSSVWIFEFGSLGFIWDLVFGAWIFLFF